MQDILIEHCRALEQRIDKGLDVTKQDIREVRSEVDGLYASIERKHLSWRHNLIVSALLFFLATGVSLYISIRSDALDRVDAAVNKKLNEELDRREERLSKSLADEELRLKKAQSDLEEARALLLVIKEDAREMNHEVQRIQAELDGNTLTNYRLVKEKLNQFTSSVDELVLKILDDPDFSNSVLREAGIFGENSIVVFRQEDCPSSGWTKSNLSSGFGEGTIVCEKLSVVAPTTNGNKDAQ